ncbi:MAG: FAD-dependent oxidoreductase [Kibdelosporangium sp.]
MTATHNHTRSQAITAAFDSGASTYDALTQRNPGYDEHLLISAERLSLSQPDNSSGLRILDAGCGTGASTAALLAAFPQAEIIAVDASAGMLAQARAKKWPSTVRFVHAPIEDIAQAGVHGPFDGIFAAYLIRNLDEPDAQLRALRELLRPGGSLAVHEYVSGRTWIDRAKWNTVCWTVVIPLAAANRTSTQLYRHLRRSVAHFDDAPAFRDRLDRAGFTDVTVDSMTGWQQGIEHTFVARRPRTTDKPPYHRRAAAVSPSRPGRDRSACRIAGRPGHFTVDPGTGPPAVAVIGGGIAGVAAAVGLAERGVSVRLFEREPDLGGRLRGWPTTAVGSPATMTRGFHAFFRQYYNLRALLRRADPSLGFLRPVADYPLLHNNGTTESFAGLPLTPPWNVAGFLLRSNTFTLSDLRRMNLAMAGALFDVSVPRTYSDLDSIDAATFLRAINFPAPARHLAFEVFSRSFFGDPSALSAAELVTMFHIYFLGSSEGLLFDVPAGPFPRTVWRPLRHYLEHHGAEIHTSTAVSRLERTTSGYTVHTHAGRIAADAVVLAADVAGLRHIVSASPQLGTARWRGDIASLRNAPPFIVSRLWLDRPANAGRAPFLGTSGFAHLDNVSVLDSFDEDAREWRARTGGSVVETHAYALTEPVLQDEVVSRTIEEMRAVYPELRSARILHEEHVLAADCPLFAPGTFYSRPTVTTDDPALVLAGDLLRVDLPVALMERAATTGFQAANALLAGWGLRGHDLWSVSNEGRSALLRRAARRNHSIPAFR